MSNASTAHHEAGHAVVAHLEGLGIRRVTIVPTEEMRGHVLRTPLPKDFEPDDLDNRTRNLIEAHARVSLAGHIAQKRAFPRSHRGDEEDFSAAVRGVSFLAGDNEMLEAYLHLLHLQTKAMVKTNWFLVEAVAQALLEQKTLSGRDVKQVIYSAAKTAVAARVAARVATLRK